MAFAAIHDELSALNVKLIGLSVDSVSAHLAWIRNIKEKMGVTIPFPVIADLNMKVATKYGMIHPAQSSTAAVRCVFFIDDKGIMRAMIYYPLQNGRFMPEIIRLVKALQTTDKYKVSTPANWPCPSGSRLRKRPLPRPSSCSRTSRPFLPATSRNPTWPQRTGILTSRRCRSM